MCKFCEEEETLLSKNIISEGSWGWGGDISITSSETSEDEHHLFIDRGFLRLVDIEDSQCIESGLKVEIKFCPMCGNKVKGL